MKKNKLLMAGLGLLGVATSGLFAYKGYDKYKQNKMLKEATFNFKKLEKNSFLKEAVHQAYILREDLNYMEDVINIYINNIENKLSYSNPEEFLISMDILEKSVYYKDLALIVPEDSCNESLNNISENLITIKKEFDSLIKLILQSYTQDTLNIDSHKTMIANLIEEIDDLESIIKIESEEYIDNAK